MTDSDNFDVSKSYDFIKEEVPRFDFSDPVGQKLIADQQPVILTGSNLVAPALKWDLEYFEEHIGPAKFAVFCHRYDTTDLFSCTDANVTSTTVQSTVCPEEPHASSSFTTTTAIKKAKTSTSTPLHIFKYYDAKKMEDLQNKSAFKQDISREDLTFPEFLGKFRGDRTKERVYFQQPLNSSVGRQITTDFVGFNWSWAMEKQKEWQWGKLTSNLMLIGQKGNVTPCHYDEQQNLFCQLKGSKRFLLFSPDYFRCLYPYPVHHPHDRQSQVDLDNVDLTRFPNFCDIKGVEAKLTPGDILYIPMYWWHHVINVEDTIAINFWHKAGEPPQQIEYPLKSRQKVAIMRNVEKMLLEALRDQQELSDVLHSLVDGRF